MIEILKWALALVLTSCVATFLLATVVWVFSDTADGERAWTVAIQTVFWCWVSGVLVVGLYGVWSWVGVI